MPHVSIVTLGVEDIARATAFYEALGWRRSPMSQDEIAFLVGGTVTLVLFGRQDLVADAGLDAGDPAAAAGVALASNLGSEHEVDELLGTAQAAGGRVARAARRTEWGGYSGYFTDPDGHLWESAHNPHLPLGDDGRVFPPQGAHADAGAWDAAEAADVGSAGADDG